MAETFRRTRMMDLPNSKKWRDRQPSPDLMKTRRKESADDEPNLTLQTERSRVRVAVVYYLSRNGQLRHPHFIEVPLSSSQWLSLRDFIRRLDQLRGKGMASPRYKNGFVWHDLAEDDVIYPSQGDECVLKGLVFPILCLTSCSAFSNSRPPVPPLSPDHLDLKAIARRRNTLTVVTLLRLIKM
ncbi:hypothetical protein CDL15_Pgr025015 [Punica granatum]|uniref:SOSEKI DIX-like domain-containing protein n=1 Tax=Punica granatum TaxID=22663 RepID=A0A218W8L6_PUNGR|nr:hypothetical protein CDL15_Pgr025015 [Punica granatum]